VAKYLRKNLRISKHLKRQKIDINYFYTQLLAIIEKLNRRALSKLQWLPNGIDIVSIGGANTGDHQSHTFFANFTIINKINNIDRSLQRM
jgi:hypothetical protein